MMVGRKRRQNVKRHPGGKLENRKEPNRNALAQLMPHRRLVPPAMADHEMAECLMGRLKLNGWLSEPQYEAGKKYRDAVGRYRAAIEAPRADEKSMAGVIVGPWGGSCMTEDRAIEVRNEYMRAFEALAQTGCERDVAHLVNERGNFILARAKCGLDALAEHYRLTKPRNSANRINRQ